MLRNAISLVLLAASAFAADSSLISLVPADAKVIGGIHVDRTVNSPFGQYVLSQMKDSDKDLREFITATGFDPRRDLREVVVASSVPGSHGPGLVIGRGVFNGPQILAAVQAKGGMTPTTYQGVSLLEKEGHAIAIIDGALGIAGESSMVRAALDRRTSNPTTSALALKATTFSTRYDAWMVTNGVFVSPLPNGRKSGDTGANAIAPNLQGILETSGGLTFGTLIEFTGEALTRSSQDAQALADVVKFIASMMQMNGDKGDAVNPVQAILQSLNVRTDGSTVKMSFSIPEQDIEKLFPKAAVRTAANRR